MYLLSKVESVIVDPNTKSPVVILKEARGERALPIWIGSFEATAITMALEEVEPPRPITHDLMETVLTRLGAVLERVDIDLLEGGVFHAKLMIMAADQTVHRIDCRPSDEVALAVRAKAALYVEEGVFDKAGLVPGQERTVDERDEQYWKRYLESADPAAFGKYKM